MFKMVILGAPGSGKGTISSRLVRDFGLKHLSSGDMLRSQIMKKTALGTAAAKHMSGGGLVPDDVMVSLIAGELEQVNSAERGWLLDGFPRTRPQAEALQRLHQLELVVSLEVPHEVIIERIKGRWVHVSSGRVYNTDFNPPQKEGVDDVTGEPLTQREDDKPESVLHRLQMYTANTEPLIEFYKSLGIMAQFHGTESNKIWPHVYQHTATILPPLSK